MNHSIKILKDTVKKHQKAIDKIKNNSKIYYNLFIADEIHNHELNIIDLQESILILLKNKEL